MDILDRVDVDKVNKTDLIGYIASEYDLPVSIASAIYEMVVGSMMACLADGKRLSLTGFGSFEVRTHKGHPITFYENKDVVSDYKVLRFIPSSVLVKGLRDGSQKGVLSEKQVVIKREIDKWIRQIRKRGCYEHTSKDD